MKLKTLSLLALILVLLAAGCAAQPAATRVAPATNQVPAVPTGALTAVSAAVSTATVMQTTFPVDLNVFAAASLTASFTDLGKLFEAAHPGVTVVFNFAGSQQLAQQINEGAPADVFASANSKQMDVVIDAGNIVKGTETIFARNRLVVVFPKDNPEGLKELKDLARSGLKLVFAAKEVPVGQYALDFLDKATAEPAFGANFKDDVLKNVVSYEDNVKAVLTKVALGEADAGIVYMTDISGEDARKVGSLDIPDALNVVASYPIAPVKENKKADLAQAFIDMVVGPKGQAVLAKYNFAPVK